MSKSTKRPSVGSHLLQSVLYTGTLITALLYLLGAYSGYIAPQTWILPSFLGLFFPLLLGLQLLSTIINVVLWDWRRVVLIAAVWALSLPQLLIYFPINRTPNQLGTEHDGLRVLSYNVCAFGFKPHSKTSPNPVLQYIKSSGADIVCLQEAMLNQNPWAGVVTATLKGYLDEDYPYIRVHRVNRGGSTLALLSKYPITSWEEIPLPSWVNGAVAYRLKIRGEETLVINVHLESFHLQRSDGQDYLQLARRGQAFRLKDALGAKLSPTFLAHQEQADIIRKYIDKFGSDRVIVCGDFNDTPLSYARRHISQGMQDAFVERGNGFGFTFHTRPFIVRIDHILYGRAYQAQTCRVDKTALESDHYPIEALLNFTSSPQ